MKRRTIHIHDWTMVTWCGKYRYRCACGARAIEDPTQPQGKRITHYGRDG